MTIEIKPLNAIVYNQEKVNMEDVIAPPYDVISDKYRDELESRSDYNFVKLILANNCTDLNDKNNRYEKAYENYQKWLNEEVLVKTEKPCILYLVQNYEMNGKKITRKGFIARNRIEDFSTKNILPHEYTMGGPKEDRLNLTKACKANFSQVFLVYSDPEKQIENAIDFNASAKVDYVNCRATGTRKAELKASVLVKIKVFYENCVDIISLEKECGVQTKTHTVGCLSLGCKKTRSFSSVFPHFW